MNMELIIKEGDCLKQYYYCSNKTDYNKGLSN